jgi:hypothetical protein
MRAHQVVVFEQDHEVIAALQQPHLDAAGHVSRADPIVIGKKIWFGDGALTGCGPCTLAGTSHHSCRGGMMLFRLVGRHASPNAPRENAAISLRIRPDER